MALRTPPSWLQQGSHPAENDRLTMQALVGTVSGVLTPTSMQVSQTASPSMAVQVSSGWAAIVGTTQSNMGSYVAFNDAAVTLSLTAADPTNPRIDIVVATVSDAYYSGSTNTVAFTVVTGTAAGSPVAPSTPANSVLLAQVYVAAGVAAVYTANLTDMRVFVATTPTLRGPQEDWTISASAATGTVNMDVLSQSVLYYTLNGTANFTLNFRGDGSHTLASVLPVGQSVTVAFMNTNGSSPVYPSAFQIDGTAVTPKWQFGNVPSAGSASAIDAYTFTIIKTASTPTYVVLAAGPVKYV